MTESSEITNNPSGLTEAEHRRNLNLQTMFRGLFMEYGKALEQHRLKEWCQAAHAVIDFFGTYPE